MVVSLSFLQAKRTSQLEADSATSTAEATPYRLSHNTRLLEQVVDDTSSDDASIVVKVHGDEFSETG
jgi:hypothetical protein